MKIVKYLEQLMRSSGKSNCNIRGLTLGTARSLRRQYLIKEDFKTKSQICDARV
jgi:hypothetical protein